MSERSVVRETTVSLLFLGLASAVCCGLVGACSGGGEGEALRPNEAEYRAAIQKAADCTREKGWDAGPVEREVDLTWNFSVTWPSEPPDEEHGRAMNDVAECKALYVDNTGIWERYKNSLLLSGAEWDKAYRVMIACLEGFDVTGVSVGDSLMTVMERVEAAGDSAQFQLCTVEYRWLLFGDGD